MSFDFNCWIMFLTCSHLIKHLPQCFPLVAGTCNLLIAPGGGGLTYFLRTASCSYLAARSWPTLTSAALATPILSLLSCGVSVESVFILIISMLISYRSLLKAWISRSRSCTLADMIAYDHGFKVSRYL